MPDVGDELRFAVFGAGFWARYQLAAWAESGAARCVAIADVDRGKAQRLADRFSIPAVYDSPARLLDDEAVDFVDVITSPATHKQLVLLCLARGLPAICQKPLAESLDDAEQLVRASQSVGVPLLVHENWRWQRPLRELKRELDAGTIGRVFRARIHFCSDFPVFDNQPLLKQLEQFILADIGTHILDAVRFLFGEARSLYCRTERVNPEIRGEDVATVMLEMHRGATVVAEMSYASRTEYARFPQTYVYVEGERGSVDLVPDYGVRRTTAEGTWARRYPPSIYNWVHPEYALVHSSMVPCVDNLARQLAGGEPAETSGEDNLETLRLVFGAYESARRNQVIDPRTMEPWTQS